MPNRVLGGIFLTIAASIWGGMFVAVKLVVDIIPPIPLVWFRYLVAFVVLSMVVIYEGINLKIDKKEDGTFTYTPQVVESREFTPKMYLYPFPQSEMSRNTNLKQNTGWNS